MNTHRFRSLLFVIIICLITAMLPQPGAWGQDSTPPPRGATPTPPIPPSAFHIPPDIQRKIERSPRLRQLLRSARGNRRTVIRALYVGILSREPVEAELAAAEKYFRTPGLGQWQAAHDLAWALVNTKEFLYRH